METTNERDNSAEEPNDATFDTIEKAENGIDIFGPFDSVEELMTALNSDESD